jgi:hypothetical protein
VAAASAALLAVAGVATAIPAASAAAAGSGTATSRSWQTVLTPPATDDPAFTAIAATGTQHAWAFESPGDASSAPAAWHLTTSGWHSAPSPGKVGGVPVERHELGGRRVLHRRYR